MKDFLKRYRISLTILTPVHIGSGNKLSKKEFVFLKDCKRVLIPDQLMLFSDLRKRNLIKEYEKYLISDGRNTLMDWLLEAGYQVSDIQKLCSYELDCSEALDQVNRPMEIQSFVKDPYGLPYIPGSSLKGALRTILLAGDILQHSQKYRNLQREIQREDATWNGKPNRNYLKRKASKAEEICFRSSGDPQDRRKGALADVLKGLRISDSRPLAKEQLTLCQKVDVNVKDTKKPLNILRESLMPGTEVVFEMLIDSSVLKLDLPEIEAAISKASDFYEEVFVSYFMKTPRVKNEIYLGGGSGYGTKTIAYELLDPAYRVETVSKLMDIRFKNHFHRQDVQKGVSPHILKCTRYGGQLCEMGKCQIKIEEC